MLRFLSVEFYFARLDRDDRVVVLRVTQLTQPGEDGESVEVAPPHHVVPAVELRGDCLGPRHSHLVTSVITI